MPVKFIKITTTLFFLLAVNLLTAQKKAAITNASNKGQFFFSWGGNRATFSKSNINFKGDNYNFSINNVTAKDKPQGWHIDYITPHRLTIPQTNAKIGYFISNKYAISLGLDHMKYVLNRNKNRTINGFINLPDQEPGSLYNGVYNNETLFISENLVKFEHTDGLNFVYTEFSRHDDISKYIGLKNSNIFKITISEGVSGGILIPRTNTTLLAKKRHDQFHLSGYGLSIRTGLTLTFFKHFFMQLDLKGGYINMNNIRTTNSSTDKASQSFTYIQRVVAFGGVFKI